jgi:hypothetical protein
MRSINRISLVVLFAIQNFAGVGRPSLFTGRKVLRAVRKLYRQAQQEVALRVEDVRCWLADWLIRLADRLVPLPQAVPVLALETAGLPEPERVPAPSFTPIPSSVWAEVENAQEVQTVSVEEGLKLMDEKAGRPSQEGKKKARATADTAAMPRAKRAPTPRAAAKRDPLREAKYEEVRVHMARGYSQKAACKAVGVPESSFRSWNKMHAS